MSSASERALAHQELLRVIRQVRRRWRLKIFLRGAAITVGVAFAAFLLSAWGMDRLAFSPGAVVAFRVGVYALLLFLIVRFLVLPLARRVSDERVALYLEEHEPSLQAALLSAIEVGRPDADGQSPATGGELSPALIHRLLEAAIAKCREIDEGRAIDAAAVRQAGMALAGLVALGAVIFLLSPAAVRHGASVLLLPWTDAEAASPYAISVEPGNATVARGADQRISARLLGFDSDEVRISTRAAESESWERLLMTRDEESGEYLFLFFDLRAPTEYFIEANGVRSPLFRIDVADLPYVERLDLEYRFPAYTGLAPRVVENGGDIAVLPGTEVRFRVTATMAVPGGRIVLDEGEPVELVPTEDGVLEGALTVSRAGFYRIELAHDGGALVRASLEYAIDLLDDLAPTVTIRTPGRDTRVNSIDEVYIEARAEDDYGIRSLELVYMVNGGEEQVVPLYRGGERRMPEVSAGHTLYLEEFELEPGDVVAYYARVTDVGPAQGSRTATSDIYFLDIRPFGREYRQADQAGPGMQGADAGGVDGALSQRQREIIAATFNLIRNRARYSDAEFQEHLVTLALAQGRLREQVETLVQRLRNRGVIGARDTSMIAVARTLPRAAREMQAAEDRLGEKKPSEALPHEQRALQYLLRAEAAYREVQVAQQQGGGGGGGGPTAEDLADLFELELDKLRNQYETVQRGRRDQVNQQIDETLERLRELARRQQQETERLRRQAGDARAQAGGGGASQRQLAEETEEAARRLERLARENQQPELEDAARRLREAAEAMRRSAGNPGSGLAEAGAALDRLEEARRRLERSRNTALQRDMEDALRRAERIAEQQARIAEEVDRMMRSGPQPAQIERLTERKEALAEEVSGLESQLERLAADARRDQRESSRRLQEAANAIRDTKLHDKIMFSRGVIRQGTPDYARNLEDQIGADIARVAQGIRDAIGSLGQSEQDRSAELLDRARNLVRGVESMGERLQRGGEQTRDGRQEPGRAGEETGAQAREGQAGEQGLQAQGGQQDGQAGAQAGGRRLDDPAGGPGGRPEFLDPEAVRQLRREMRERRAEAETLRRALDGTGVDPATLDDLIRRMRALEDERAYGDIRSVQQLQAQLVEGLKEFEYALRRALEGGREEKLFLSGSDEVPPEFRKLVEEYYRSLAGQRQR